MANIVPREAFRIDWNSAIQEAEVYVDKVSNSKGMMPDDMFNTLLHAGQVLNTIKRFYQDDAIDFYLEYLDENRTLLKGA